MRILLACNAGMSSSILVKKIKDIAVQKGLDVVVEAKSYSEISAEKGRWDVCMVGPQIIYAVDQIKQTLRIPVAAVEARTYAMADGAKALEQAMKMYEER